MKKLIVGITGASGAIYGIRLLEAVRQVEGVQTHLIVSDAAALTIREETDWSLDAVRKLADATYAPHDIGACLASGSFRADGMIVAPCSIKTMSMIANSIASNLLIRAADVTLKERRKLILLVRETPLHLGHLRLMTGLAEIGAIIAPPVPAFYNKPETLQDIINHTTGRLLDHFGIEHALYQSWTGTSRGGSQITA